MHALIRHLLRSFRKIVSRDPYRPELHYMRGPGPASEKRCAGLQPRDGHNRDH